jgi:localization factor PodJL
MNSAQSWSVRGIDPKVREAAREAAARQGMSLGEYLNLALANKRAGAPTPPPSAPPRPRSNRLGQPSHEQDVEDDWQVGVAPRSSDPGRLAHRIEAIERRTQLAVTSLDRAVATIDRAVDGLAARVEEAEAVSGEAAERIADALEHFRVAGETIGGGLERAERDMTESRLAFDGARADWDEVRERLEEQVAVAEGIGRRAEAAAAYLSAELENRDAALTQTLEQARAVPEEAARHAAEASSEAFAELRALKTAMDERLAETQDATRRAVAGALEQVRGENAAEARATREALLEEVVRIEVEVTERLTNVDRLKGDGEQLIARIERAETSARETTAGLRQAAGAAIADLRNAQLSLTARVKQIEETAAPGGDGELKELRHQQQDIAERLATLETKTAANPFADALAAFERRLAGVETDGEQKLDTVDGALKTMDQHMQRLAARMSETESTANTAIRTLEETVCAIGARVEQAGGKQTEAVRAMLEQRLDTMAQSVEKMVGDARDEVQAALESAKGANVEDALADINRRLAGAERRQAQTIEAISLEIRRMSETVDKRLRTVESRNDDAAASAVREELSRMSASLEQRFDDIERREAAGFDRMGLEVGRLSERLEERVGAVEGRSAQAIEQVGEQVARMAERFNQRQEMLARDLGERMLDSEERAGARVTDAIGSIMQRLAEVEQNSAEAIAPVQKAVSSVASKLDRYESERGPSAGGDTIPTPSRRFEDSSDFSDFGDRRPSPMAAAQPLRAGPLPPLAKPESPRESYFSDDDDLLVEEAPVADAQADWDEPAQDLLADDEPEPAREEEAFWTPAPEAEAPPEEYASAFDEDERAFDVRDETPALPGKNDYLANARKAALAQSQPKARGQQDAAPQLGLRGSSRVVLWGAAGVVAAAMVAGAWYVNQRTAETPAAAPRTPAPAATADATTPTAAPTPAATTAPTDAPAATTTPAPEPAIVAGPLAPRNVSMEQAAQAGDLTAQYELALQRLSAGAPQEGAALLRRAADRGFAMAQYRLAKLYERGEGVGADLSVARQWTERAAASGNRRAMHDLGVYFARGEGAPLDEAAAFRWFRQAAELGVADSQYNLGVLYQQGRGVSASPTEALFWFLVAARQGDQDAATHAAAMEAQLSPMQVEQARERAQAFRSRAASAVANGDFGARAWTRTGT